MTARRDPPMFEPHDAVGDRREESQVVAREHDAPTFRSEVVR